MHHWSCFYILKPHFLCNCSKSCITSFIPNPREKKTRTVKPVCIAVWSVIWIHLFVLLYYQLSLNSYFIILGFMVMKHMDWLIGCLMSSAKHIEVTHLCCIYLWYMVTYFWRLVTNYSYTNELRLFGLLILIFQQDGTINNI